MTELNTKYIPSNMIYVKHQPKYLSTRLTSLSTKRKQTHLFVTAEDVYGEVLLFHSAVPDCVYRTDCGLSVGTTFFIRSVWVALASHPQALEGEGVPRSWDAGSVGGP